MTVSGDIESNPGPGRETPVGVITDDYKRMLDNVENMDRFELKRNLHQFSVEVCDNEETQTMKTLLKKAVVEELLKTSDGNKSNYEIILDIANSQLHYAYLEKGYKCTLVGCRYTGNKHIDYVRHVKQCHPNISDVLCNFKKSCKQRFCSV